MIPALHTTKAVAKLKPEKNIQASVTSVTGIAQVMGSNPVQA